MGWMESFAKEEQERKARESIKQIQIEYAVELEREVLEFDAALGYKDAKAELDELKLDEEIDRQIDEARLKKHEDELDE